MIYNFFADYTKKAVHTSVEYAFPRTASIALTSAATGWYAYQYTMTYGQGLIADIITEQFKRAYPTGGAVAGHLVAPFFVPWIAPYLAGHISLGVSLTSSFTLNVLAQKIFGIEAPNNAQHPLPNALKTLGLESLEISSQTSLLQSTLAAQPSSTESSDTITMNHKETNIPLEENDDIFGKDPLDRSAVCWNFCQ